MSGDRWHFLAFLLTSCSSYSKVTPLHCQSTHIHTLVVFWYFEVISPPLDLEYAWRAWHPAYAVGCRRDYFKNTVSVYRDSFSNQRLKQCILKNTRLSATSLPHSWAASFLGFAHTLCKQETATARSHFGCLRVQLFKSIKKYIYIFVKLNCGMQQFTVTISAMRAGQMDNYQSQISP